MRTQLEPLLGIKASCRLSGINRSTYYRHRDPSPKASHKASRTSPPNRLSPAECHHIIAVLNSERFRDKAPRQVWAALLDETTGALPARARAFRRLYGDAGYWLGGYVTPDALIGLTSLSAATLDDDSLLRALKQSDVYGAVLGKALYTGAIDLKEALALAKE